jgi:hypothetical protein
MAFEMILDPRANHPPASNPAQPAILDSIFVLDFDASTAEYAVFLVLLPNNYAGGTLTLTIGFRATATSGNVVWNAQWARLQSNTDSLASLTYATAQAVTLAAPAANTLRTGTITFSSSQIDSAAAGEFAVLRISRDASNGSDTMTGDARLTAIALRE